MSWTHFCHLLTCLWGAHDCSWHFKIPLKQLPLFVFLIVGPKQNAGSLLTPVSDTVFDALSHGTLVLHSMVALKTTYFKESDWLLKNFHQSENGWKSYHGEQNRGYHVKEHKKLCQKQVSKVTLHFVRGQLSRKQTVLSFYKKIKCHQ